MKKALGVFLMTAMAFGAFADEPVADVNIAEFSGNAAVQWGVDLDSGTTGFKNSYEVNLKLNLLNNGTKSTTGDGVWGELVLKTEEDTFIGWENGDDSDEMDDNYINANTGLMGGTGADKRNMGLKVYVDTAKIHIGPAYIGIKRGDTKTGKLKMDAAIRSADDDQSVWLTNVGPDKYSEGIVLGVDSEVAKVDLDLRSYVADNSNHEAAKNSYQYTDAYAAALEAELKGEGVGLDGFSAKVGTSFNFAQNYQAEKVNANKTSLLDLSGLTSELEGEELAEIEAILGDANTYTWGYSASLGYKLGLDDTFYIRPQVGFTGQTMFFNDKIEDLKVNASYTNDMAIAAGLLFGWGEIGLDQNAGVYYLDDDMAKKVSPGVGVVAYIPLPETFSSKVTYSDVSMKMSAKAYDEVAARIMPSFYSGELIPGLTAAAYADIVVQKTGTDSNSEPDIDGNNITVKETTYQNAKRLTPMAFALGAKYDIGVDEMTITPKFGLRFANAAYVDYGVKELGNPVFGGMGAQDKAAEDDYGITSAGNYLNLKLGVDVAGLVDNTTLSVTWATNNILNKNENSDAGNVAKFGTLNFKAKIAL